MPLIFSQAWLAGIRRKQFVQQRLDLLVAVKLRGLFFENEVGSHATAGKILYAVIIFRSIGVSIEMAWTIVAMIFQKFDQPERAF